LPDYYSIAEKAMTQDSSKERQILMVMRKVLAQIIKDTTPEYKSMRHPLSEPTIQDIRQCLGLISSRERELAETAGVTEERPYFTDEKPKAEVVSISSITGVKPKSE
jgi:hypothetical protein